MGERQERGSCAVQARNGTNYGGVQAVSNPLTAVTHYNFAR
jgi:hypothetical protein